jgi:glycosyltransferase involved in cell wall biosynthesis
LTRRFNPSGVIKILWLASADRDNTNAQSLNAREIALRLDPEVFRSTFFYQDCPDPRLLQATGVQLLQYPQRGRTWTVLKEMVAGYRLITYLDPTPASYVYVHLPRLLRGDTLTVIHVEGPFERPDGISRWLAFLRDGIVGRADFYTGISEFIVHKMEAAGLHATATLPVGVDTRRFTPPAIPRQSATPSVLFVGTLIERKGVLLILDVARQIPHAQFLVAGAARDGFDEVVRRRIEEYGLKNVRLLGPLSQDQIVETMQASDIFLLPSQLEGIPKVTLEAAATGLPCVLFSSYQTPSVVDGVTGFQVSNLQEMVERVKLLVDNPDQRRKMGAAATCYAKSFDWEAVAAKWQQAYLRMAGRPARLHPSAVLLP